MANSYASINGIKFELSNYEISHDRNLIIHRSLHHVDEYPAFDDLGETPGKIEIEGFIVGKSCESDMKRLERQITQATKARPAKLIHPYYKIVNVAYKNFSLKFETGKTGEINFAASFIKVPFIEVGFVKNLIETIQSIEDLKNDFYDSITQALEITRMPNFIFSEAADCFKDLVSLIYGPNGFGSIDSEIDISQNIAEEITQSYKFLTDKNNLLQAMGTGIQGVVQTILTSAMHLPEHISHTPKLQRADQPNISDLEQVKLNNQRVINSILDHSRIFTVLQKSQQQGSVGYGEFKEVRSLCNKIKNNSNHHQTITLIYKYMSFANKFHKKIKIFHMDKPMNLVTLNKQIYGEEDQTLSLMKWNKFENIFSIMQDVYFVRE